MCSRGTLSVCRGEGKVVEKSSNFWGKEGTFKYGRCDRPFTVDTLCEDECVMVRIYCPVDCDCKSRECYGFEEVEVCQVSDK